MRTLFLIVGLLWVSAGHAGGLLVIASNQVPANAISIDELADVFTLKKNFWGDKTPVVPVNREASSVEREMFSETVFNLSTQDLGEYWNKLRFQGRFPPLIQTSDQAVVGFVRSVPGAIGYISANHVPAGVKVLLRIP